MKYSCPGENLWIETGKPCLFGKFRFAFQKMVQDFKAFNPEADRFTFSNGLAQSMQNNGWWDQKIMEYLDD
jgi:hypothetical protein